MAKVELNIQIMHLLLRIVHYQILETVNKKAFFLFLSSLLKISHLDPFLTFSVL
jgi:hypothetical protein